MEIFSWLLIILAIISFYFLFYNKKIVFELDDRYYNQENLNKAAVEYLRKQGRNCEIINNSTLLIDGQKYFLSQRTICAKVPVQQVVLKKSNKI
ncbi:TPA: hypothetical protein PTV31_001778 [Clostridium botulinum]|nr:hypothetical protein [Clostridium botulinum]